MISREKILELLKGLQAKTEKGQVRWNETRDETGFYVAFATSSLRLSFHAPSADFDYIEIGINNDEGRFVGKLRVDEDAEDWTWVKGLFDTIEATIIGSDRVLGEIEEAIHSGGPIGMQFHPEPD